MYILYTYRWKYFVVLTSAPVRARGFTSCRPIADQLTDSMGHRDFTLTSQLQVANEVYEGFLIQIYLYYVEIMLQKRV